jgi:hypothetical protein
MIDNKNTRNFYSDEEMAYRQKSIVGLKSDVLNKINDLRYKIETEEPFPHGNMDLEFLVEASDRLEEILNSWYY